MTAVIVDQSRPSREPPPAFHVSQKRAFATNAIDAETCVVGDILDGDQSYNKAGIGIQDRQVPNTEAAHEQSHFANRILR